MHDSQDQLLRCPLLAGRGEDEEYLFDRCRITTCKYYGPVATGNCIAMHTLQPSAAEIAAFKKIPISVVNSAKSKGRAAVTKLLILQRYAAFSFCTGAVPELPASAKAVIDQTLQTFPYNDQYLGVNVNEATFAAMVLPSTYANFIQTLNLEAADKNPQHQILHMALASYSLVRKALEATDYNPQVQDQQ